MSSDIPVYGLDKELLEKQQSKYDPKREQEAREWIEILLNQPVEGDFFDALKDGTLLCKAVNAIQPNTIKINNSQLPFKQMENINQFLKTAEQWGVPKNDLFQTIDLYERKNQLQVIDSLFAVARTAQKNVNQSIPLIGPKLSDKHQPQFTKEQLDAGKNMPTLQSGFYAAKQAQSTGATQSGMQYGQGRQILAQNVGTGDVAAVTQQSGHFAAMNAIQTGATASGVNFGGKRDIIHGKSSQEKLNQ